MKKTVFLYVILLVLICPPLGLAGQSHESGKGDVNNDGVINVLDMVTIANHILGTATLDEQGLWRADLNGPIGVFAGDGAVNVLDIVKIANVILGIDEYPAGTITDIDGNTYHTVTVGSQVWMVENLRVAHYRNGDPIANVTDNTEWIGMTTGGYCDYLNTPEYVPIYGRLYNWYAVDDDRNIAPEGWRIPSDEDWKQLEKYLGMSQQQADTTGWRGKDEGNKLKEAGPSHWGSSNWAATNTSGFTALPGGYRDMYGYFGQEGSYAFFWSSTEAGSSTAWFRHLYSGYTQVYRYHGANKFYGCSVRCLKNN